MVPRSILLSHFATSKSQEHPWRLLVARMNVDYLLLSVRIRIEQVNLELSSATRWFTIRTMLHVVSSHYFATSQPDRNQLLNLHFIASILAEYRTPVTECL